MVLRGLLGAGVATVSTVLLISAVLGSVGPRDPSGFAPGVDDIAAPPTILGWTEDEAGEADEVGFSIETAFGRPPPVAFDHIHRFGRGDTLGGLLQRVGLTAADAQAVVSAMRPLYDPRKLRAGQEIVLSLTSTADEMVPQLGQLSFPVEFPYQVVIARDDKGGFAASRMKLEVEKVVTASAGVIRSSLFADDAAIGVPNGILAEMLRVFAWDIDFQRDIHEGDQFAMVYDRFVDGAGETVQGGGLIAATLILGGKPKTLYRFDTADGRSEYYTADGHNARKALLRTPVDGARLSSRFGMRRHPILGYSKMHKGVDFAAPAGTPIYAAGDGVVEFVGRRGGYGNYVRLRHRSGFATAYAHLSRYGRGLRAGQRVDQGHVIGYVGSTGRSTGPHLHYEIIQDGRHINPASVKMLPGQRLTGTELARFRTEITSLQARLTAELKGAGAPVVANLEAGSKARID